MKYRILEVIETEIYDNGYDGWGKEKLATKFRFIEPKPLLLLDDFVTQEEAFNRIKANADLVKFKSFIIVPFISVNYEGVIEE